MSEGGCAPASRFRLGGRASPPPVSSHARPILYSLPLPPPCILSGQADFLIATDLASRGLDIRGVTTVINFELPSEMATYVRAPTRAHATRAHAPGGARSHPTRHRAHTREHPRAHAHPVSHFFPPVPLSQLLTLPPPLRSPSVCGRCIAWAAPLAPETPDAPARWWAKGTAHF